MDSAYARSGVDTQEAAAAVSGLVNVLRTIRLTSPSRSLVASGHYASVLEVMPGLAIALSTDGVGSKVLVAEQAGRFDTIGVDCVAMNVNDVICVGARPIAMLDYIAVSRADVEMLRQLAEGLKRGAERAEIEIPGGEVAQLPELLRGSVDRTGFDISGCCVGLVETDSIVRGTECAPGDVIIGLPSSGVHANGLTLARRALLVDGGMDLDSRPTELGGSSVGEELLRETEIYVRAACDLLASDAPVHGLAHITSDGLRNLLRLEAAVGFEVCEPLPVPPVFRLIQTAGNVSEPEMHDVFNMGCGFCCVVPAAAESHAVDILASHHPGARRIGSVTSEAGKLTVPSLGLVGDSTGLWMETGHPAAVGS
jgi:phosphoribosylformylglycinamidine cyclo-ligase